MAVAGDISGCHADCHEGGLAAKSYAIGAAEVLGAPVSSRRKETGASKWASGWVAINALQPVLDFR